MLGDITIGQYYPGDSVLHKLDPRTKILAILVYMVSLFIVNNFYGLLGMMAISILVYQPYIGCFNHSVKSCDCGDHRLHFK